MSSSSGRVRPDERRLLISLGVAASIVLAAVLRTARPTADRPSPADQEPSAIAADPAFEVYERTDFGAVEEARNVTVQADGMIVACGASGDDILDSHAAHDIALARYGPDGKLDPSFGVGGKVVVDLGAHSEVAEGVVALPDGHLLVAGSISGDHLGSGDGDDIFVARFNSDGSLDRSFGKQGVAALDFGRSHDQAVAVAVQKDGAIVVAGSRWPGRGALQPGLARFTADGAVDIGFGVDGVFQSSFQRDTYLADVVVDSDGSLLLALNTWEYAYPWWDGAVARVNAKGALDPTFGRDGIAVVPLARSGRGNSRATSVLTTSDGKVLIAGSTDSDAFRGSDILLTRFFGSGQLDPTFGAGPITLIEIATNSHDSLSDMVKDASGRLLLVSRSSKDIGWKSQGLGFALRQADGSADLSFGSNGTGTAWLPFPVGATDFVEAAAILHDGRGVVVGTHYEDVGQPRIDDFMLGILPLPAVPPVSPAPSATAQATATPTAVALPGTPPGGATATTTAAPPTTLTPDSTAVPTREQTPAASNPPGRVWLPWLQNP